MLNLGSQMVKMGEERLCWWLHSSILVAAGQTAQVAPKEPNGHILLRADLLSSREEM